MQQTDLGSSADAEQDREPRRNEKVFVAVVATESLVTGFLYLFGIWQRFYASLESMIVISVVAVALTTLVFVVDALQLLSTQRDLTGTFDESNRAVRDVLYETANQWLRGALLIHLVKMAAMHPLDESFYRQNFLRAVGGIKMCIAGLRELGDQRAAGLAQELRNYMLAADKASTQNGADDDAKTNWLTLREETASDL